MEEKREEFEVVDRRRANTDAAEEAPGGAEQAPAGVEEAPAGAEEAPAGAETAAASETQEQPPTSQEEEAAGEGDAGALPDVNIEELLFSFIGMLQGFVAQKMGFVPNQAATKAEPDLAQAQVAMGTVDLLVGQLEPRVDATVMRELRGLQTSFVMMLRDLAWQKMGFVANRATGQVESDLPQAKAAIDAAQAMVGRLETKLGDADLREIRRIMMDLQMNYLRRNSSGS